MNSTSSIAAFKSWTVPSSGTVTGNTRSTLFTNIIIPKNFKTEFWLLKPKINLGEQTAELLFEFGNCDYVEANPC